jgi:hypothetical protein
VTNADRAAVDALRCRYTDCPEAHTVADENERITCNTCRRDMGLDPLTVIGFTRFDGVDNDGR